MRHLRFSYRAVTQFSVPVTWHYFKLRCRPCRNACQKLSSHRLVVSPDAVISTGTDSWGNAINYGRIIDPCDGSTKATLVAPVNGVIFFAHNKPLVLSHTPVIKLVCR